MAEKKDIDLTLPTNQLSVTRNKKSIIASKKVALASISNPGGQVEKEGIFPDQRHSNSQLATGSYSSPYFSSALVLSSVSYCLPSSNPVLKVLSLQGEIFID